MLVAAMLSLTCGILHGTGRDHWGHSPVCSKQHIQVGEEAMQAYWCWCPWVAFWVALLLAGPAHTHALHQIKAACTLGVERVCCGCLVRPAAATEGVQELTQPCADLRWYSVCSDMPVRCVQAPTRPLTLQPVASSFLLSHSCYMRSRYSGCSVHE
jgi:hypothetical protein